MTKTLAVVCTLAGVLSLAVGAALVYVPASFITVGVILLALGMSADYDEPRAHGKDRA